MMKNNLLNWFLTAGGENWILRVSVLIMIAVLILLYFKSYQVCISFGIPHEDRVKRKAGYFICGSSFIIVNAILFSKYDLWKTAFEHSMMSVIAIITTVLISFFGLTAASYTFLLNDLHGQQRDYPNYREFIDEYLEKTRFKFTVALWVTVLVSAFSIGVFIIHEALSTQGAAVEGVRYECEVGYLLCVLAIEDIIWMMYLNWVIFFHERYIDKYAQQILICVNGRPARCCFLGRMPWMRCYRQSRESYDDKGVTEGYLKRISDLELIFKRLLKNSEHTQGAYPLENQAVLAICPDAVKMDMVDEECLKQAKVHVDDYYELLLWRNAIVRHANSAKQAQQDMYFISDELKKKLEKLEKYVAAHCLTRNSFSTMDLSRIALLKNANLTRTDFRGADLSYADLSGSQCSYADFSDTIMEGIYFVETGSTEAGKIKISADTALDNAKFAGARLEAANFNYMVQKYGAGGNNEVCKRFSMEEANFSGCVLTNSLLRGINLKYAAFERAQMYYARLDDCLLPFTAFIEAQLPNSLIKNCNFANANFSGSNMVGLVIASSSFTEARFHNANMANSMVIEGDFCRVLASGASMKGICIYPTKDYVESHKSFGRISNFSYAVLRDVDFTGSEIYFTDLSEAQMNDCIFVNSVGEYNDLENANLSDCIFTGTMWKECIFDHTKFNDSVFKNVDFTQGRFKMTRFEDCSFVSIDGKVDFEDAAGKVSDLKVNEKYDIQRIWDNCYIKNNTAKFFFKTFMEEASFKDSIGLRPEMFSQAVLKKVDFSGTGLKEEELKSVCGECTGCKFN